MSKTPHNFINEGRSWRMKDKLRSKRPSHTEKKTSEFIKNYLMKQRSINE